MMEGTRRDSNSPQVDVILRSADGHDFKLHKYILSLASPVFDTMFTLPQPSPSSSSPEQDDTKDGLPVVKVAEKKKVLQRLLGMYLPEYLEKDVKIASVYEWKGVFNAANKYEMKVVAERLSWDLEPLVEKEPLRVFALATHHGMPKLAKIAAMNSLKMSFGEWGFCPELVDITGADLQNLFLYHAECGKLASLVLKSWQKLDDEYIWYHCTCTKQKSAKYSDDLPLRLPQWWLKFVEDLTVILEKRPRGVPGYNLVSLALMEGGQCSKCTLQLPAEIMRFKRELIAAIDEGVSKIELKTRV